MAIGVAILGGGIFAREEHKVSEVSCQQRLLILMQSVTACRRGQQ
jgi:hypothetical protein